MQVIFLKVTQSERIGDIDKFRFFCTFARIGFGIGPNLHFQIT